jgi:hypothetical protein
MPEADNSMEKELTKKLLRNETCDNCYAKKADPDLQWCIMKSCKPKENTCEFWMHLDMRKSKPPGIHYARR